MAVRINRALWALLSVFLISLFLYASQSKQGFLSEAVKEVSRTENSFGESASVKTVPSTAYKSSDSRLESDSTEKSVKNKPASDVVLALLSDPIPRRQFADFAHYSPHNVKEKPGKVYATFFCTRISDPRDPFFAATQSIVWRILWSKWHSQYPIIVYVCPFTPEEQRVILRAQGAIVKETELLDVVPLKDVPVARWRDQFSKLNMWNETDYSKIVYLDVDAFPIANIDDVFDLVPEQNCIKSQLSADDKQLMKDNKDSGVDLCKYTFGGVDPYGAGEVNGGFLVLSPNVLLYKKLLQDAKKTSQYEIAKMEQGLLHSKIGFGQDGPFPATLLPLVFNAVGDYYKTRRTEEDQAASPDGSIRVIHEKIWNGMVTGDCPELNQRWDLDWMTMCRFYDSDVYVYARETGRLKDDLEIYTDAMKAAGLE